MEVDENDCIMLNDRLTKYREIMEQAKSLQNLAKYDEDSLEKVQYIWKELDTLTISSEEKRAEDVLYDIEIVEASAVVLEDFAASINVNSTYNLEDFANAIIDMLSEGPDKWCNLRKEFSKSVPCKAHFSMFYNIPESIDDFVERKRVIRKTAKEKENSKSQPSQVTNTQSEEEENKGANELFKTIRKIYSENRHKPVPFTKELIDPGSFTKSVENVFNLAFLVRDNHINMCVEESNLELKPRKKRDSAEGRPKQVAAVITFDQWKKLSKLEKPNSRKNV